MAYRKDFAFDQPCKRGHPIDWYTSPKGWTVCRYCRRENVKASAEKHKERIAEYVTEYRKANREKLNEYDRKRWIENPERKKQKRASVLKTKYGLTYDEYQRMWDERDGKCEICDRELLEVKGSKGVTVDHNHITNEVRGLICGRCNSIIGFCEENKTMLNDIIAYLKKHDPQERPN